MPFTSLLRKQQKQSNGCHFSEAKLTVKTLEKKLSQKNWSFGRISGSVNDSRHYAPFCIQVFFLPFDSKFPKYAKKLTQLVMGFGYKTQALGRWG